MSQHDLGETTSEAPRYPCADCGVLRTKDEGGTTFTVCDECWDKHWGRSSPGAAPSPPTNEFRDAELKEAHQRIAALESLEGSRDADDKAHSDLVFLSLIWIGGDAFPEWQDEFAEWYQPSQWMGPHRALNTFLATKIRELKGLRSGGAGDRNNLRELLRTVQDFYRPPKEISTSFVDGHAAGFTEALRDVWLAGGAGEPTPPTQGDPRMRCPHGKLLFSEHCFKCEQEVLREPPPAPPHQEET